MGETTIRYHADHLEPARPAIDVKLNQSIRSGGRRQLDETRDMLTNVLGETETESLVEIAQNIVFEQFWTEDLPRVAKVLGFEVQQVGKSGGWVVITNADLLNDPDATDTARKDWVSRYSQLRDFCDRETAEAFNRMSVTARNLAQDDMGRRTVTIRAIEAFRASDQRRHFLQLYREGAVQGV